MNEIFTRKESSVETTDISMISIKDCPNHCVDGYYIDPYKHKRIKCQYCAEKRKLMVRESLSINNEGKNISEILNLPKSFIGYSEFNIESVIPDFASKVMIPESVAKVSDKLRSMIQDISIGVYTDYSIMFNLGQKAFEGNFVYSYLFRAFENGLTVAPYTSSYDLHLLRFDAENGDVESRKQFDILIKSEVCVIVIDAGSTHNDVMSVKGLMQIRASKDKSTIIIANAWNGIVKELISEDGTSCKNLATLYSIEYTPKYLAKESTQQDDVTKTKTSQSKVGMDTDAFNKLMSSRQSL